MKFKVLAVSKHENCHVCLDERGQHQRVDLMVNGDFPLGMDPNELVGKEVECEYTYPCISIAMHVRIIEPTTP